MFKRIVSVILALAMLTGIGCANAAPEVETFEFEPTLIHTLVAFEDPSVATDEENRLFAAVSMYLEIAMYYFNEGAENTTVNGGMGHDCYIGRNGKEIVAAFRRSDDESIMLVYHTVNKTLTALIAPFPMEGERGMEGFFTENVDAWYVIDGEAWTNVLMEFLNEAD